MPKFNPKILLFTFNQQGEGSTFPEPDEIEDGGLC